MLSPKKSGKTDPCMTKKLLSGKTNLKKTKNFFREIKKEKMLFLSKFRSSALEIIYDRRTINALISLFQTPDEIDLGKKMMP